MTHLFVQFSKCHQYSTHFVWNNCLFRFCVTALYLLTGATGIRGLTRGLATLPLVCPRSL